MRNCRMDSGWGMRGIVLRSAVRKSGGCFFDGETAVEGDEGKVACAWANWGAALLRPYKSLPVYGSTSSSVSRVSFGFGVALALRGFSM
jgi:hypothetical protein